MIDSKLKNQKIPIRVKTHVFLEMMKSDNSLKLAMSKPDKRDNALNFTALTEVLALIEIINKLKGNFFSNKNNKFYLNIFSEKLFPFDFLCTELGLQKQFEEAPNIYEINETTEQVKVFLEILEEFLNCEKLEALEKKLLPKMQKQDAEVLFKVKHLPHDFFPDKVENLAVEQAAWMNEFINAYRQDIRYIKARKQDDQIREKYQAYCDYVESVIKQNEGSFIFTMRFKVSNRNHVEGCSISEIKKQLFNKMRSYENLALISGYIGFWEVDESMNLAFRCYFIVPDNFESVEEWTDNITYYWEDILFEDLAEKYHWNRANLSFRAESLVLSQVERELNIFSLKVSKRNSRLINKIREKIVAYVVLSDFYFSPFGLQILLHAESNFNRQSVFESMQIKIDGNNKISKVFRGHIKSK